MTRASASRKARRAGHSRPMLERARDRRMAAQIANGETIRAWIPDARALARHASMFSLVPDDALVVDKNARMIGSKAMYLGWLQERLEKFPGQVILTEARLARAEEMTASGDKPEKTVNGATFASVVKGLAPLNKGLAASTPVYGPDKDSLLAELLEGPAKNGLPPGAEVYAPASDVESLRAELEEIP